MPINLTRLYLHLSGISYMTASVPDSALLRDFCQFVDAAVFDPLGTGISMADFLYGGSDEDEAYPEEHAFQRYVGWVASNWVSDLLDAAKDDPRTRERLDSLASSLDVFSRDDADDEEEDQSEFEWEFIGAMADSLAETVAPQLMAQSDVIGEFNLQMVRWIGGGDRAEVDIRPPVAPDELVPGGVPAWAERLVRRGGGDHCSRCRRPLAGAGVLDYRVGLNLGGVRDVANLELVCEGCAGKRPDEETVSSSNF